MPRWFEVLACSLRAAQAVCFSKLAEISADIMSKCAISHLTHSVQHAAGYPAGASSRP